jgi:lysophospholipase L1-like esterase
VKSTLARIALALGVFTLMLSIFELGFRIAGYRPLYEIYSKPSLLWRMDEQLGWSHQPNSIEAYRGPRPWPIEYSNEIHINSLGLRGVEPGGQGEDAYRILFMGDSMIAGFEVAEHETLSVRVQEELSASLPFKVETINAGVRGYGTDQSYLYYKQRGHELKPDLVVFMHSANDFRNNMTLHQMRRLFGKGAFALQPDGELVQKGVPVPEYPFCSAVGMNDQFEVETTDTLIARVTCALESNLSDRSAFFTFVTQMLQRTPLLIDWLYKLGSGTKTAAKASLGVLSPGIAHAQSNYDEASYRLTIALLSALHREVRSDGAEFLLWISDAERAQLGPYGLDESGIEIFEVVIWQREDWAFSVTFKNDSHWNAFGHRRIGDVLTSELRERVRRDRDSSGQSANPAGNAIPATP